MSQSLLDYYKAIESASTQMLQAAKDENWDQVARLEGTCAVLIGQLHTKAQLEDLAPQQRPEKCRIMQQILRNDAELRYLTEPWLMELENVVDARRRVLH